MNIPVDMHIACSADGKFVIDCAVMLQSLFASHPDQVIKVHFPHNHEANDVDLERLSSLVESCGGVWNPLPVSSEEFRAFPFTERFGYNAWYRILLPRLLPDLDKVLYLDSDMLICSSLSELWQMDLSQYSLAAVTQPILASMRNRLRDTLGIDNPDDYFNSGVMMMNLSRLRAEDMVGKVLTFIGDRRAPMPWADQDPLNAVLHTMRASLHPRWNCMTPLFHLPNRYLPFNRRLVAEATGNPAIVHFIGAYKPWHYLCRNPMAPYYFEYLAQTPWRSRPMEGRNWRNRLLRWLPEMWLYNLARLGRRMGIQRRTD